MRLLMIRHGDPDYEHDCLTERGNTEAELLAQWLKREEKIDRFFVSPLGRAQETARHTTSLLNRKAVTLDWLQEFPALVDVNGSEYLQRSFGDLRRDENGSFLPHYIWDMKPAYKNGHEEFYSRDGWRDSILAEHSNMKECWETMCSGLDALLSSFGYERDGDIYRVRESNHLTIALFCHFGVTAAMLSYLWGVSPVVLWHSTVSAPTSVTELVTEEREEGIAIFRMTKFGSITHLQNAGQEPSFAARFCETFQDDTRH